MGVGDTPILFSGAMVRGLLQEARAPGTGKTETRRLVKPQPAENMWAIWSRFPDQRFVARWEAGDRLWVRETWWHPEPYSYGTLPSGEEVRCPKFVSPRASVHYAADGDPPNCANRHYGKSGLRRPWFAAPDPWALWTKRSSIHMPRWASRITLTVKTVHVERLKAIDKDCAKAEGIYWSKDFEGWTSGAGVDESCDFHMSNPVRAYEKLWDRINGLNAWDANPWVTVTSFSVRLGNIDS